MTLTAWHIGAYTYMGHNLIKAYVVTYKGREVLESKLMNEKLIVNSFNNEPPKCVHMYFISKNLQQVTNCAMQTTCINFQPWDILTYVVVLHYKNNPNSITDQKAIDYIIVLSAPAGKQHNYITIQSRDDLTYLNL